MSDGDDASAAIKLSSNVAQQLQSLTGISTSILSASRIHLPAYVVRLSFVVSCGDRAFDTIINFGVRIRIVIRLLCCDIISTPSPIRRLPQLTTASVRTDCWCLCRGWACCTVLVSIVAVVYYDESLLFLPEGNDPSSSEPCVRDGCSSAS